MTSLGGRLARVARQFLLVDRVRLIVGTARYLWYVRVRRQLRTLSEDQPGVTERTVFHNLLGLADRAVVRSSKLVRPLSALETLGPDARVLSIGPRTEGELLNLVGHGFRPEYIRGVDLISYSPWVDLGNMHSLPYPDSSFDATIMSFVLSYSDQRELAAAEMVRVTRPGGVIAVGVEWNPLTDEEICDRYGYTVGTGERITSVEQMLGYFGDHVGHVYYHHHVHPSHRDRVNSMCVIFEVRK